MEKGPLENGIQYVLREVILLWTPLIVIEDILSLVEQQGGNKYGFGLNFEQPLADDGETGIFGRLG